MSKATPVACDLEALTGDERARRAPLAIDERADGYALRFDFDPATAGDAFEWLVLERRCCPFLRLQLLFEPADNALWVSLGGSSEIKAFLAGAGLAARRARLFHTRRPHGMPLASSAASSAPRAPS